ncbi:MAG: hypothetical protein R3E57_07690 [Porticoccaceae bacterium]
MEGQILGTDGLKTASGEFSLVATIRPAATPKNPDRHEISITTNTGTTVDRYCVRSSPEKHWAICQQMIDKLSTQLSGVSALLPIEGFLALAPILRSHDEKTCNLVLARIHCLPKDFWPKYMRLLRSVDDGSVLWGIFRELFFLLSHPWDKRQALTVSQLRGRTLGVKDDVKAFRLKLLNTFAADISLKELVTLAHGEVGGGALPSNIPDTTLADLLSMLVEKLDRDLAYFDEPESVPVTYNRSELKALYRGQVTSGEMGQEFESVKNIAGDIERKPEEYSEETREAYRLRLEQISEWEKDPEKWIEHKMGEMYDRPLDFRGQWMLSRANDRLSGNNTWESETLAYEQLVDHFIKYTRKPCHPLAKRVMGVIFGVEEMKHKELRRNYNDRQATKKKWGAIARKNK